MKRPVLVMFCLTAALALAACGEKEQAAAEVEAAPAAASLLSHVPAGTPYLAANLQPVPADVLDANFARLEPVLAEMQAQLGTIKSQVSAGAEDAAGNELTDRLLLALLQEFDGKLSRPGLESLGWDMQSTSVFYGEGAFPVARVGLSNPATLKATILRVLENAEISAPELEFQGMSYWRIASPDEQAAPVAIYVAVLPDHLAVAVYPAAAEADYLPRFLGLETPADGDAAERLAAVSREHGFTPYGAALFDLHRLADEFLDPGAITARSLIAAGAYRPEDLGPTCAAETHRIIDSVPFIAAGVTEMTVDAMAYRVVSEMPTTLAERMVGLVSRVPIARSLADHLAELSFGIRVGAVRDFMREKAQAVLDEPFRCEQLADINDQAQQLLDQMNQPMPPFVNNFRGVRLSLKSIEMEAGQDLPKDVRGHLALQVDEPEMFVGMAQMFLPDLADVQLAPGSDPARVPEFLISVQGIEAWAAMSDEAIGISVGAGEQNTLLEFLEADAGPEGLLFSADYDNAAWYEFQERGLLDAGVGQHANPAIAVARASVEAMKAAGDRNHVEVKFTPKGLQVDNRFTYK